MTANGYQDKDMEIPWNIADAFNGFALDIGHSLMKLIYIDKADWTAPNERKEGSKARLKMKTFTITELEDNTALMFIKSNAHMKKEKHNKPVICGTGIKLSSQVKRINEKLDINVKCVDEMQCIALALVHCLKSHPFQCVVRKLQTEQDKKLAMAESERYINLMAMFANSSTITLNKVDKTDFMDKWYHNEFIFNPDIHLDSKMEGSIFPCILSLCGSSVTCLMVNEDGTCVPVSKSRHCGKLWSGIGSILTNAKKYEELLDLAGKGSLEPINMSPKDMVDMSNSDDKLQDGNIYSDALDKFSKDGFDEAIPIAFYFDKADKKSIGDFKREDLAVGYLHVMVSDIVSTALNAARIKKRKHVFFCGGFVDHPLVATLVYREWMRSCTEYAVTDRNFKESIHMHILMNASHFGAIGALLKQYQQTSETI